MAREKQRGQEIRKCPISYKKTFMLAALDSVDDIGARSLYTTLLDFARDCKFDHDLVAGVSE